MGAADTALQGAKKFAKPAAVAAVAWIAKKFGDKAADNGYEHVKNRRAKSFASKENEAVARDLARARGWRYTRHVVDHAPRYVVFDCDNQAMAAFPPVDGATTPEALRERFELNGFVPNDDDLCDPAADAS